jgi:hypothetical protein
MGPVPPSKLLGLLALGDVLVGLVLAAVGLSSDHQVLAVVGAALLLSGGGMLAWVVLSRNRPEAR